MMMMYSYEECRHAFACAFDYASNVFGINSTLFSMFSQFSVVTGTVRTFYLGLSHRCVLVNLVSFVVYFMSAT